MQRIIVVRALGVSGHAWNTKNLCFVLRRPHARGSVVGNRVVFLAFICNLEQGSALAAVVHDGALGSLYTAETAIAVAEGGGICVEEALGIGHGGADRIAV